MSKITTIEDKNGDVWTGAEVDKSQPVTDAAVGFLTFGMTALADAISGDDGTRTVAVNGEEHTGQKVG